MKSYYVITWQWIVIDSVDNTVQPLSNEGLGAYRSYYHFPGFYGG